MSNNVTRFTSNAFGMAAMPFLCNGTLLFQGNLPRVLPMIIYKYFSCLIPYIFSFLIMCGEWSSLVFKDFKKYFCFLPNVFSFCLLLLFLEIVCYCKLQLKTHDQESLVVSLAIRRRSEDHIHLTQETGTQKTGLVYI